MSLTSDVFERMERRLRMIDRDGDALTKWSKSCPHLAVSGVGQVAAVPGWVSGLRQEQADEVVRVLVGHAQARDEAALLAVLVGLRPGLVRLGCRLHVPLDDVVSEAALRVLNVRLDGRRRVISGLLLDVRKRFWLAISREPRQVLVDPAELGEGSGSDGRQRARQADRPVRNSSRWSPMPCSAAGSTVTRPA
jgi:hypothetical protein